MPLARQGQHKNCRCREAPVQVAMRTKSPGRGDTKESRLIAALFVSPLPGLEAVCGQVSGGSRHRQELFRPYRAGTLAQRASAALEELPVGDFAIMVIHRKVGVGNALGPVGPPQELPVP